MRPRVATADDADAILDIYRPIVLDSHISFEYEPPDAATMRRRIERTLDVYPWIVADRGGDRNGDGLAGYAYATRFRGREAYQWSAETTVYVAPTRHRRGVGRELMRALLGCLRVQGFHVAVAGIALPNPESAAFHERLGFDAVGVVRRAGFKAGRWHDVGFWQRELATATARPGVDHDAGSPSSRPGGLAAPTPFREIARSEAVRRELEPPAAR